jgi:hypothetical protein
MKRPKRGKAKEHAVFQTILVLQEEIFPVFDSKKKITQHRIHKDPKNKYFKMFLDIFEYLEELRKDRTNPLKIMLSDYFKSIYIRHKYFNRKPYLNQLAASPNNRIKFEEWIERYEDETGEEYFTDASPETMEIFEFENEFDDIDVEITEV